jgi:hypothetical protein
MKVLLKIAYTQEYDVVVDDVDSITDAMAGFDPCEDLTDAVPVYGGCKVEYACQIKDCTDCGGKGYHWFKNPDGTGNSKSCKTCNGDGYLRK